MSSTISDTCSVYSYNEVNMEREERKEGENVERKEGEAPLGGREQEPKTDTVSVEERYGSYQ